jgi:NADH-quinone oxidoreductase subunit J
MNFETFFFFFFSSIALTSGIFVIYSPNTIYSAFFLILVFVSTTGLLLVSEIEFLSIMLIIIYVGAIAVLFLFVIMMLDIHILVNKNNQNNFGYLPIIILIGLIFFIETFLMFSKNFTTYHHLIKQSFYEIDYISRQFIYKFDSITNIETLGQVLYTYYFFLFLLAGIILLIALIGAVLLTKKEKKNQKYLTKNLYKQLSRNYLRAVFNIKEKK